MVFNYLKLKIRKYLLKLSGRTNHLNLGLKCKSTWYGSRYGGFYINPQLLNENSIIYSFGIGEDISFDKAIIEKHSCIVFGFDPTPKSIEWIKNQKLSSKFQFNDYGIGKVTGSANFYFPKNPNHVSGSITIQQNIDSDNKISVYLKSFSDIITELGHKSIDVLKMDIEGSEYELLEDILKLNFPINQILIEFHDRLFSDGKERTVKAIQLLKSYKYEIFGISDTFEEISFIKRDSINSFIRN